MKNPPKLCKTSWRTPALVGPRRTEGSELKSTIARLEERHAATERMVEQMRVGLPETFKSLASEVLKRNRSISPSRTRPAWAGFSAAQDEAGRFSGQDRSRPHGTGKRREKLSAHIDKLFESNTRISDQANNLAIALRGSSKSAGGLGELILERTLQAAGCARDTNTTPRKAMLRRTAHALSRTWSFTFRATGTHHRFQVSLVHHGAYNTAESEENHRWRLTSHLHPYARTSVVSQTRTIRPFMASNSIDFVIMFLLSV